MIAQGYDEAYVQGYVDALKTAAKMMLQMARQEEIAVANRWCNARNEAEMSKDGTD